MQGLTHEFLDGVLTKRRQHVAIEAAAKSFDSGESDVPQNKCFVAEEMNLCSFENFFEFLNLPAFVIMISEYRNHGYGAGDEFGCQVFRFGRQSERAQVAA